MQNQGFTSGLVHGLFNGCVERENLIKAGKLDDLPHRTHNGDENQLPILPLKTLARAEKSPETGGTQIVECSQIYDQGSDLTLDQPLAALFQFRSRFCVQAAGESEELPVAGISLNRVHD